MVDMSAYTNWEGTIEELAKTATQVLRELGQDRVPPPNVRVIRDYASRGILSPAERRGKELYYSFQHLNELVAAKVLVNEGVPLAKIADQFMRDRDIVIVTLGLHAPSREPANAARQRWQSMYQDREPGFRDRADNFAPKASTAFMQRTIENAGMKTELTTTLRRLGRASGRPRVDQVVRIVIAPGCSLSVEKEYLRELTAEQAEDIGQAVTAILSDPKIKRGVRK